MGLDHSGSQHFNYADWGKGVFIMCKIVFERQSHSQTPVQPDEPGSGTRLWK